MAEEPPADEERSDGTAAGPAGEQGDDDAAEPSRSAGSGEDPTAEPETAPADAEAAVRTASEVASAVDRAAAALDEMAEADRDGAGGAAGAGDADDAGDDADYGDTASDDAGRGDAAGGSPDGVPEDVRTYERFTKMDGARYERVNEFLRERTYITAREWAMARLCADFRTETGVEMTKIGDHLPELVPFMTDTYSPQAVNQARASFEEKVRMAGATFLYGAMCDFFTAEELDEIMYEVTEVAKFLLEVEGVDLEAEAELEAEDRISGVMRDVRRASEALRYEECPSCGHDLRE